MSITKNINNPFVNYLLYSENNYSFIEGFSIIEREIVGITSLRASNLFDRDYTIHLF